MGKLSHGEFRDPHVDQQMPELRNAQAGNWLQAIVRVEELDPFYVGTNFCLITQNVFFSGACD